MIALLADGLGERAADVASRKRSAIAAKFHFGRQPSSARASRLS